MLTTPQDILRSFDALPIADQQVVAVAICRRLAQVDTESFSDEELCLQADELFVELDQREAEDAPSAKK